MPSLIPAIRDPHPHRPVSISRAGAGLTQALLLLIVLCVIPTSLEARQSDEEPRWRNATELTFLLDGGNSAASTLGIRNTLRRTGALGRLRLDGTAIRTDATRISRTAVGTSEDDFRLEEDRDTERSAERYGLRGRYDRDLTERTFAFTGVGWERNTFAGFNSRTVAVVGAGGQWARGEEGEFRLGAGLTYTVQDDVTPDPERDDAFAGLQVTVDLLQQLTQGTEVEVAWVFDGNAQEPSDLRGDLLQSVSATLTNRLALKTTLQLKVDNDPPLESIPLVTPDGTPVDQEILAPLRRMDHSLSVALVITL
jgi:putative salt-induced outer membrane protein YdiY